MSGHHDNTRRAGSLARARGVSGGLRASPLSIEAHAVLPPEQIEPCWAMYCAAFDPLRGMAAARQVLSREEFLGEMGDERLVKHVAYDKRGTPIAMLTLTQDLESIAWISPEYYERRFPEQSRRRAVYYLGFILVAPEHQGTAVMERLVVEVVLKPLSREKAVLAFDTCGYNQETVRLTERIAAIIRRNSTERWEMTRLDVQHYYDITWS
jgi:hypothetical protein